VAGAKILADIQSQSEALVRVADNYTNGYPDYCDYYDAGYDNYPDDVTDD